MFLPRFNACSKLLRRPPLEFAWPLLFHISRPWSATVHGGDNSFDSMWSGRDFKRTIKGDNRLQTGQRARAYP